MIDYANLMSGDETDDLLIASMQRDMTATKDRLAKSDTERHTLLRACAMLGADNTRLTAENEALRHDLEMVLRRPVFRPDEQAPPPGQKILLRTTGGICVVGCAGQDTMQWAELPTSYRAFMRQRRSRP